MATAVTTGPRRSHIRVRGTVQGVGFRPYVFRLAEDLALSGYVFNDAQGVLVEVEGPGAAVGEFLSRLPAEAPPLARIETIEAADARPVGQRGFTIRASPRDGVPDAPVAADTATCAACLAELFDPADRRFRYPFINCTDCGPRFTIVGGVPYDRPLTTMAGFRMCAQCRREYEDPRDRRFHAQPNACPECGPQVRLLDGDGAAFPGDPLVEAAAALERGAILAVKGIGGFHLACRADCEAAVERLRARKHREEKPFALMARDLDAAGELVELGAAERLLLSAPARPIVLAQRRPGAGVAPAVAPGAPELGVMLPYSPLHHLLLATSGTLVLTSGNVSEEPIAFRDEDALRRLAGIAGLWLLHDRPIKTRTDDSVARVVQVAGERRPSLLRRSRGYVPESLPLPAGLGAPPLLACGAELKSTFCLARGGRAWVSHHIGDLHNAETWESFRAGVEHFERLFSVRPEVVAHDLHPQYLSTQYALAREQVETVAVQHHHAHLAACLAEHGETGPAVGVIYDGAGLGDDGTVWGGELLCGDLAGFRRSGALAPVRLPGADRAVRQPWRMACAWLQTALDPENPPPLPASLAERVDPAAWQRVSSLARSGLASPLTTSMGRLFDAVSALCGLRTEVSYEGQAAIELEAACDPQERGTLPIELLSENGRLVIDPRGTILALERQLRAGVSTGVLAARFHNTIAAATARSGVRAAELGGTELVVLAGGVFANRRLLQSVSEHLHARGLRVLVPTLLPAGDGGISYGQAAVAAARYGAHHAIVN